MPGLGAVVLSMIDCVGLTRSRTQRLALPPELHGQKTMQKGRMVGWRWVTQSCSTTTHQVDMWSEVVCRRVSPGKEQVSSGCVGSRTAHGILDCVALVFACPVYVARLTLCKFTQRIQALCMPRGMALEPTADFEHVV